LGEPTPAPTRNPVAPSSAERARRVAKPAPAATPAAPEEMVGPVIMRNDSRDQVLDLYERWTGKILLRPAQLPEATFTLTLDKPLPKSEALRALETLFNLQGIGFAPLGERFIKVSQLQLTRTEAPEFVEGSTLALPPSGRIATKLFTLEFLRVGEFVPQISQLINPNLGAAPITFDKTNAVLVVESISNLQRIEELIVKLDRPSAAGLAVKSYPVVNAKASDLVNQLRTLLGGPLAAMLGTTTIYQPDDRTNQVILISDAREQALFDDLIAKLDTEASPNTRSEVVFLKHATATEVEALLAKLVSGQSGAAQRSTSKSNRLSGTRLNPTPAANATPQATPAPANLAANAAVNAVASEEFSELLTIVADERSNAIVIAGTPNDIKLIKSLVDRLDVLLAQVRIEVVIAEVTLQDDASSGISALGLQVENNKLTGISATAAGATFGSGTTIGSDGKPVTSTFGQITNVGAGNFDLSGIVSLSTTPRKNNSSILQTPSIVTTHNKEAEIFVGETRPVISGTTTGSSGAATGLTSSSTVTQQEIGIRLRVLPLIGSSGAVQLEVEQEVEDVLGTVKIDGNDQPRIGRRTTTSYVSARNGDIIVLGGLQRASQSKNTSRLGPLPWIGDLFGSRSRSKGRTELVFFLRPIILTNTYLDNVEAMKRIDSTPQAKQVREITDQRPAAAPYVDQAPLPAKP
jgi:general secretion pathway protein D